MLEPITVSIILGIFGLILGSFLPVCGVFLYRFIKKRKFGFKLILQIILGLFIILFLYMIVFMPFGFLLDKIGFLDSGYDIHNISIMFYGLGTLIGFIGGSLFLVFGIRIGLRQRRKQDRDAN